MLVVVSRHHQSLEWLEYFHNLPQGGRLSTCTTNAAKRKG
jgi:hypothetical protein